MNSLKIKFLGLCCIILMVAIGLTTWYNLQTQKAMLSKLASEHGRMLTETIRNSIITDMANGKNDQVGHILGKINNEPAINSVRIFDESGRILMAAKPEEIVLALAPPSAAASAPILTILFSCVGGATLLGFGCLRLCLSVCLVLVLSL